MTRSSVQTWKIGLLRRYSVYLGAHLSRKPPVIVYQMGKVASSAVRNSLLLHGVLPVLHLHSFFPLRHREPERVGIPEDLRPLLAREIDHARRVFERAPPLRKLALLYRELVYNALIYRSCVRRPRRVRFISLVRDPVAVNLSMFFQLFPEYVGQVYAPGACSTEEVLDAFVRRYNHSRPLTWFDAEMKPSIGIDVYETPFAQERGFVTLRRGGMDLLILQCELPDAEKEAAIAAFLGLTGFRLVRGNVASDKAYGPQYREARRRLRLPEPLLDRLYDSRYMRHFYATADRDRLRSRWSGRQG